jgi:hypothetical protein
MKETPAMSDDQTGPYGQQEQPGAAMPAQDGSSGRGRGGRATAVAVGALVVVGAVIGGFLLFSPDSEPDSKTKYKLTTPKTVAGEYERDGKGSKGDGRAFDDKKVPGMESGADVSAKYQAGTTKKLQLGGAYGTVKDPEKAVDWVFEQTSASLKTETGAKPEGGLQKFKPSGFDGEILKCQKYEISNMGLAMCGWADSDTVGTISSMVLTPDGTSTEPVDLRKTAEMAAKVRKDALVEVKPAS